MIKKINISIDDVSPHELSNIDVVDRCFRIIDKFSDVKFTLFVPTAYWRTVNISGRIDTRTTKPLIIADYPQFCDKLRQLPKSNFEVCYHGRFHGIPNVSNNDEMRLLTCDEFINLWSLMKNDVIDAGLENTFINVIRPPAMYMSQNAIYAADDLDIDCLALSPRRIHRACYAGADEKIKCHVVYANAWIPDDNITTIISKSENIEILYHACSWDGGYFNDHRMNELMNIFQDNYNFQHSFIRDIDRIYG